MATCPTCHKPMLTEQPHRHPKRPAPERAALGVLDRLEATVKFLYPEDMTPNAKRVLDNLIEEERSQWRLV